MPVNPAFFLSYISIMKKDQGFTLIELIMVVAIMGILFTITFSGYGSHSRRLNQLGSALQLTSEINWATNYAGLRNTNYVVMIWDKDQVTPNQYQVEEVADDGGRKVISVPGEGGQTISVTNGVNVLLSNCDPLNPCQLTYNHESRAWTPPDVSIELSNSGNADDPTNITLGMDTVTGIVYVQ